MGETICQMFSLKLDKYWAWVIFTHLSWSLSHGSKIQIQVDEKFK